MFFIFLASNGDTSVSGADADGKSLIFTDGNFIDVYLNGVRLKSGEDYNTGLQIQSLDYLHSMLMTKLMSLSMIPLQSQIQFKASEGGTFSGDNKQEFQRNW